MLSTPERLTYQGRSASLLAAAVLLGAMLSACAGSDLSPTTASGAAKPPAQTAPAPAATGPGQPPVAGSPVALPDDAVARLLAYADRVRLMPPAELTQEISRLATPATALEQLQLALALAQLRQLPELIRAQELLARVLGNNDAQTLHPLARLLAARYGEQRRVEELLDKQSQQTREVQRRLDQTNERVEALKAIERSLTSRPAASAPAPAGRTRQAAP